MEMEDFLEEEYQYYYPRRGDIRMGVLLSAPPQEIVVDIGAKRDGIVPPEDLERLGEEAIAALEAGDRLPVYVLRAEDREGNLLVSLYRARQEQDWMKAQELAETNELWEGQVTGHNKGGLIIPFGEIRGFLPASQITGFPRRLSIESKMARLAEMVGQDILLQIIEVNRRRRRLIFSERAARHERRAQLMASLTEGQICWGAVTSIVEFGAFVDLGGADGLVHISELAWDRVRHPREVLQVGDRVQVYVLRLDHERKRIGLSIKRLQPEPWSLVEDKYEVGQLAEGVVTNVTDFGAFARIEEGVEGLIHVSELAEGEVSNPHEVVKRGDRLLLRIIRMEPRRQRLGLSLKRVLDTEWAEWVARVQPSREVKEGASVGPGVQEPEFLPEPKGGEATLSEENETPSIDEGFWGSLVEES